MRPTNCANNFSEAGITNVNGYSDLPPTIIETTFSVPINVPSLTSSILYLRYSSHSHFHVYYCGRLTIVLFSFFNSDSMIWKSSADDQMDGYIPKIYGVPKARTSYKLNLRNYGSNYIGIRITEVSTVSVYFGHLTSMFLFDV